MCGWLASTLGMIAVMSGAGRPETIDFEPRLHLGHGLRARRRILLQHLARPAIPAAARRREPATTAAAAARSRARSSPRRRRAARTAAVRPPSRRGCSRARRCRRDRRSSSRRAPAPATCTPAFPACCRSASCACCLRLLDTSLAMPKSRILSTTGVRAVPSVARNRLSGLRSRWTMPRSCAADSAFATWLPIDTTVGSALSERRARARQFARLSPRRYSMTM